MGKNKSNWKSWVDKNPEAVARYVAKHREERNVVRTALANRHFFLGGANPLLGAKDNYKKAVVVKG